MRTQHEEPSALRLELLGHLAAACRLAMAESPDSDGVQLSVTAGPEGFTADCVHMVGGQPVSGWGQ